MGTDIHLFVEYASPTAAAPSFQSLTDGEFCLTRDYKFFAALSEVRGGTPLVPSRGLPADISDETRRAYYHLIAEDDSHDGMWQHVSPSAAQDYVSRGCSHLRDLQTMKLVSDPDAHSPSWLTRAELSASLTHAGLKREILAVDINAMLAALDAIPDTHRPRVAFWFDN